MILTIGGEKGGTGKSTTATNHAVYLAHAGASVVIIDADPQGTSWNWYIRRTQEAKQNPDIPRVACIRASGDIYDAVAEQAKHYDHVIIDAGGFDSDALRSGLLASHKAYIPLQASQPDLETISGMAKMVGEARRFNRGLEAMALISRAPTNPVINEVKEAREVLSDVPELVLSGSIIRERKAYRDAMLYGFGVIELDNGKAKAEVQLLAQEIYA